MNKFDPKFPYYEDDSDYNTNANSYYKDLARKQKLIQLLAEKIWEYDERLDERLEDLENILQDYLSQWDTRIENLDDEVSHIFVTWLNDGTLEQIINHDVLGNKADKTFVDSEIERLDLKDENIITQLEQTNENLDTVTLVGDKFGIVADGVTDDSDAIQYLLDNSVGVIQLPRNKKIYLGKPLIWEDSNINEIDFGFSEILAPNGVIKINRQGRKRYQQKPTLKNGFLNSMNVETGVKTATAIEIGTNIEWGSSVRLDKITIRGYKIGFYGNSLFELETMSVKFERNEIGMYLHSEESGNITDCSQVNDIYFDYNKYALIISKCINMTFNNLTIEHSDYGIVITGYDNTQVLFSNTYFENNNIANITTGTINLNTLTFTQDSLGDNGLNGVKFEQTRYRADSTHAPIFNEDFPFTSKYLEIGENFSERLLSGGELETKNIITHFPTRVKQAGDNNVFIGLKKTPFGEVDVVEIDGNNFNERLALSMPLTTTNVEANSTFLFKCIIKIEIDGNTSYRHTLTPQLMNSAGSKYFSEDHAVYKRLRTNRWEPFSRIIEMRKENLSYDGTLVLNILLNNDYSTKTPLIVDGMKITLLNPMVINLTDVFGKGNEPTLGMEDEVSNWFKYNGDYVTD